ncbi:MAG TPA: YfcE family phosphodiesterase [Planctomycetaceae bacterium]|nr:YfcE family phosphodiesterase [Planctomycetaceae bacterium]HQZ65405.1 YfcE family phosphodiesterase [Planctomycetaceae bacterium]
MDWKTSHHASLYRLYASDAGVISATSCFRTHAMRILLIADIHSNWPALAAIDEDFDACLFLGDVVDYATDPVPCIEWVRRYATSFVRGNHDHSVAQRVLVRPGGTFRKMVSAMRPHHFDVLNDNHLTWLAQMPVTRHLMIGEHRFLLVHATPRDPLDEYIGDNVEHWQQRLGHVDVDFVCVGHTHIPMQLQLEKIQVINPGSVGQPRDGDPRAAYAIIDDGQVEFRRVAYDIDRTIQHMRDSGIEETVIDKAEVVLRSGGNPTASGNADL